MSCFVSEAKLRFAKEAHFAVYS